MRTIYIMPGELKATAEPMELRTILGSCVAVALYDPDSKIAGLNHYLLPNAQSSTPPADYGRYGDTSIPILIRRMVKLGAKTETMQAHIVGGGAVVKDLVGEFSVGDANIELARDYLSQRGIRIIEERVGGDVGRHLSFDTASLRINVREIKKTVVLGRKHAS